MEHLAEVMRDGPRAVLEAILADTGYLEWVRSERTIEAMGREENLRELVSAAEDFEIGRARSRSAPTTGRPPTGTAAASCSSSRSA